MARMRSSVPLWGSRKPKVPTTGRSAMPQDRADASRSGRWRRRCRAAAGGRSPVTPTAANRSASARWWTTMASTRRSVAAMSASPMVRPSISTSSVLCIVTTMRRFRSWSSRSDTEALQLEEPEVELEVQHLGGRAVEGRREAAEVGSPAVVPRALDGAARRPGRAARPARRRAARSRSRACGRRCSGSTRRCRSGS